MAELALRYGCPLVVSAPHDIALLRSLVKTLVAYGVADPYSIREQQSSPVVGTIHAFSQIRRAVFADRDELLGYPLWHSDHRVALPKISHELILEGGLRRIDAVLPVRRPPDPPQP